MFSLEHINAVNSVNKQIIQVEKVINSLKKDLSDSVTGNEILNQALESIKTPRWYYGLGARQRYLAQLERALYLIMRQLIEYNLTSKCNSVFLRNFMACIECQETLSEYDLHLRIQPAYAFLEEYNLPFSYFDEGQVQALRILTNWKPMCGDKAEVYKAYVELKHAVENSGISEKIKGLHSGLNAVRCELKRERGADQFVCGQIDELSYLLDECSKLDSTVQKLYELVDVDTAE